jgi:hypothetical protein
MMVAELPGDSRVPFDRRDKFVIALLLALSACFSALQWSKIASLWGDSPRSLFETYRVFRGDMPFRDVSAPYPPLSMYAFAVFYKLFGQTFATAQILLDILSTALIISTYLLARQFLRRLPSAGIAMCLAIAGVGSESAFALYSLNMYTPSALLAPIGLNLFLIGLIGILRSPAIRPRSLWLVSLGASLAILSRTECLLPVSACLGLTGLCLWYRRRQPGERFGYAAKLLAVGLLMLSPAILVYVWLVAESGLRDVVAGLLNYGNATMVCPYWPTGIGLLGFLAGLGEAGLVYISGSFLLQRAGRTRWKLLWGAILAIAVMAAYLYAAWDDFPRFWALPGPRPHASPRQVLGALFALTHVLMPVMGAAVVLTLSAFWRSRRVLSGHQTLASIVTPEMIVCLSGAALCIRSLFGSVLTELPGVSSSSYPILFVIAGILLSRVFASPSEPVESLRFKIARAIPSAVFFAYGAARLSWFFMSAGQYYPLETIAGRIRLEDRSSVSVYNYVVAHTGPDDLIADLIYGGGGVNFSARRPASLFMTTLAFCIPSEEYLWRDANRIKTARPRLVIAEANDHLGTMYGGGTVNGCTFPHLVWRSGRITGDPTRVLPVVSAVKENYTPVFRDGNIQVLERNDLVRTQLADSTKP